jgi:type VI protein secretion system component VasK
MTIRRQISIVCCVLLITVSPLALFAQMRITPEQSWRIAAMFLPFFFAVWMLIREISAVRAAKLVEEKRQSSSDELSDRSVEDRLDELERLKRRDLVTPEEYAAKRQEILKDL